MDCTDFGYCPVAGFCEHSVEPSGSITFDELNNFTLLKKNFVTVELLQFLYVVQYYEGQDFI
jgi:hypothetical protein